LIVAVIVLVDPGTVLGDVDDPPQALMATMKAMESARRAG